MSEPNNPADLPERQHEPTCAYRSLPFKTGSGNRICSCPGRVIRPATTTEERSDD